MFLFGFTSFSCMHLGMIGGGTSDSPHQAILEKETVASSFKVVALFPPLAIGDESHVMVKVNDRKTEKPMSKAQISIRVELIHDDEHENQTHGGMMMHQMDPTQAHTMHKNHDIDMEILVSESSEIGKYNAYFTPSQSGSYKFIVTLASVEGYTLENPIVIEGTRMAMPTESSHGGMHGGMSGSTSTWLVVSAAVMGAMMIAIVAFGGRMF
jgi:hypothetical protein